MAPFTDPVANAEAAEEALSALARATRRFAVPNDVGTVLGSLSQGLPSLAQSLHQLGGFHDGSASTFAQVGGNARQGRAAAYQISWDLHRAAEMLQQVAEVVRHACDLEATIAYDVRNVPRLQLLPPAPDNGLSL